MANRRDILKAGLAISVARVLGTAAFLFGGARRAEQVASASDHATAKPFALDGLIFDKRFAESVEAATGAVRHGATLYEIDGDVTDLWYHHLDFHWRGKPGAFAGITGADALFVIENLAWDRRLRVIYRGRHAPPCDGFVEHLLSGPMSLVAATGGSKRSDSWTHSVGSNMARWSGLRERAKTIKVTTPKERAPGRRATLISWIVVPCSWGMDQV
jgi:hypothetical protein